ncbi:NAD-binding 3-hydroxyacyl-CoA dehydrogenase [Pyrolobus fumarii 1A]|uniref:NAD-binding 3-hydroxyacyl-CoA dehydrogenase n=1 Tax=Pyrolobus fumarii (strain DSM 11204 / 1A) TaxID=694429 RepID=G0EH62_PYRF1|nr:3-hydroxyacyl-CoA dehydrogenase/enoyl-CoA hydratase family protein [Pyrolobus fumarii]AEM39286.1 NAD-binding 3-hydroxyacyl-CoA dehydrogenase [Pyrolobus fumarii 1A]
MPLRPEEIKTVLVVGAGVMGHGIAQVFAMNGYRVRLVDIKEEFLRRALERIRASLEKLASKGALREPIDAVMARIETSTDLRKAAEGIDYMVEAVPEKLEIKRQVFKTVDEVAPPHAILTTNTSSIPISEIAEATSRPEKVAGMHFFNPPQILKLVEVVRGAKTSDDTVETIVALAKRLGKEPVVVRKDVPGFIVNRVMIRILNESCRLVEKGVYTIEQVDAALRFKLGFPMGAFELADYIGLDVLVDLSKNMISRGFNMTLCKLFEEMVESGKLGVKSGEGFYKYPGPGKFLKPSLPPRVAKRVDYIQMVDMGVNEGAWLVENGVADPSDVDKATVLGLNLPMGILALGDLIGLDKILESIDSKAKRWGLPDYQAVSILREKVEKGETGVSAGKGFHEYRVEKMEFASGKVVARLEENIGWVILNRPEARNALNPDMLKGIREAIETLIARGARAIVLMGAGGVLSAGFDIRKIAETKPQKAWLEISEEFGKTARLLEEAPAAIIVAIDGYALGGGLELALAADIRIASDRATLGQPEINLGFIPGAGGTQRLVKHLGVSRALWLVMTGEMIDAETAEQWGLVADVVPASLLEFEARLLAKKLAEKPPLAIAAAKRVVRAAAESSLAAGLAAEAGMFSALLASEDAKEGIRAFLEKRRAAKFRGE